MVVRVIAMENGGIGAGRGRGVRVAPTAGRETATATRIIDIGGREVEAVRVGPWTDHGIEMLGNQGR